MTRPSTWAIQKLATTLEPDQRDAVLGDLVELKKTDRQILQALLRLSFKRQVNAFGRWEPWVAVALSLMLFGPALADISANLGREAFIDVWMKWHNRISFFSGVSPNAVLIGFVLQALALSTWAWSTTFALHWLSPRTAWLSTSSLVAVITVNAIPVRSPFAREFVLVAVILPIGSAFLQSRRLRTHSARWIVWPALWTLLVGVLSSWVHGWGLVVVSNWSQGGGTLTLSDLFQRREAWPSTFNSLSASLLPTMYLLATYYYRSRADRISALSQ